MTSALIRPLRWVGIGLIGLGVLWESVLAPNLTGWGLILAGFLVILVAERRWPVRTPLDAPLLLLAVMGGVSLAIAPLPQVTQTQVMWLGAGLAGFYGLANWARDRARLLQTAAILIAGGAGLALLAPVVVDWSRNQAMLIPNSFYEPFPLLVSDSVHPNIMAALMVLLFPLALAWFISFDDAKSERLLLGTACLLMGLILLLTKSRGGYIAAAGGSLIVLWLSVRKRWALTLTLVLTLLVTAGGAWLLFGMENKTPELIEQAADPSTWAFRQQVWRTALWMMADFFLTGVGMGLFNNVAPLLYAYQKTESLGAHNLYLQIGVDLGIPGLIAYLAALMLVFRMAGTAAKTFARRQDHTMRAITVGALAGMAAMTIHGLVDATVWGTRAAFLPWLMIGFTVSLFQVTTKKPEKEPDSRAGYP